jgi:phosphoribosylaminoimidazole (AIR) synthetase
MGIGMVLVIGANNAGAVADWAAAAGVQASSIGTVVRG